MAEFHASLCRPFAPRKKLSTTGISEMNSDLQEALVRSRWERNNEMCIPEGPRPCAHEANIMSVNIVRISNEAVECRLYPI